jgi:zinc transport system permease protein
MGADDTLTLAAFFDAWDLFRDAALAGTLAGALLGWLGVFVVLRRMVFLSAALSQAAGLGVAAAFYAQVQWGWFAASPTLGAVVATGLATALLVATRARGGSRDSVLGLAYLVGAAGTLALGTRITQEVQDIETVLFGSAVAVVPEDFRTLLVLAVGLLLLHAWWERGFVLASFDPDGARVRGVPVGLLDAVLLGSLALAASVCARVIGALPVFAFTVLPALAAVRLVANARRALALAAALGGISGFLGYLLAFRLRLPVGASQTLVAAALVPLAEGVRQVRLRLVPRGAA